MKTLYDSIWERGKRAILSKCADTDPHIDDTNDRRRGLTVILKPNPELLKGYQSLTDAIRVLEPTQYIYPSEQIHTTVLAIVTCTEGFSLEQIDSNQYVNIVRACIEEIQPFQIRYQGVTASPACIMVQGFDEAGGLEQFRALLKHRIRASGLMESIDQRYEIQLSHSTLVRFRHQPARPKELISLLTEHRNTDWGTQTVNSFSLVCNDWYHRPAHSIEIATIAF